MDRNFASGGEIDFAAHSSCAGLSLGEWTSFGHKYPVLKSMDAGEMDG
jgi:hypothetical protein